MIVTTPLAFSRVRKELAAQAPETGPFTISSFPTMNDSVTDGYSQT
jgi:hypothetical protein